METLWQDFRYGLRLLLKSPGFAAVAVVSLALGIGANTTIFTLVNTLFLKPLPVEEPASIMAIFGTDQNQVGNALGQFLPVSQPNLADYRKNNSVFSGLAITTFGAVSLSGLEQPVNLGAQVVSANYFDVLGVKAALGRTFSPEEDTTLGTHPVVVLTHDAWARRFGSDPTLVGRTILLNRLPFTVIGVMPEGFHGTFILGGPDVWIPLAMRDQVLPPVIRQWYDMRRALICFSFARLKPGVTPEQAQTEMAALAKRLEEEFPNDNDKRSIKLVPLAQAALGPNQQGAFVTAGTVMMGAVGLVLLIACSNVANLLLSRAAVREREIGIRVALGASRGRLLRQLLTESLVLATLAGVLGLFVAYWARDLLWSLRPPFLAQNGAVLDMSFDARVLLFTLGLSVVTGLVFGLAPALQASRTDLVNTLKERTAQSRGLGRLFGVRNILVMGQVALSMLALIGSGLFVRSLWKAQQIDPGFNTSNLAMLNFDLGTQGYDQPRGLQFYRNLSERLNSLPMVQSAGLSSTPPFAGGFQRTVFPEGVDKSDRRNGILTPFNSVDAGYLEAMGIPILRGRNFTPADREGAPLVAIVTEAMVRRTWPNEEPLGKRFTVFGESWVFEVVGVARNSKYLTLGEPPQPIIYVPIEQIYTPAATLHVRTKTDPASAIGTIRAEVQAMDRNMPLTGVNTMQQVIDQALWAPKMGAGMLGLFGFLALFLASLGIYGVMSYSVTQRTHEIGIRMALGAQTGDVMTLILRQGAFIVGAGLIVGLGAGAALTGLARSQMSQILFGVDAMDPLTFGGTAVVLALVALLASYLPARRATRVDPIVALHYE